MRKRDVDFECAPNLVVLQKAQRWAAALMLVARQEMGHLAIVCNLLNAVGVDVDFERPNFPQPAKRYPLHIPFRLDPFGMPALRRFVWFEKPDYLVPTFSRDGYCGDYPRPPAALLLESVDVPETKFGSVQELYKHIAAAFQTLNPTDIFLGNSDRQVDGSQFGFRIMVEPVTNREQAAAAVELIVEQGEGIGMQPLDPNGSHFQMFTQMLTEFEAAQQNIPDFNPTLDVVENPVLAQYPGTGPGTIVTHPPTRVGMELFNDAYQLLTTMLRSLFHCFSASQNDPRQAAELYAAFFPLMTMVIRPLGEILTRMPAGVEKKNAGPSFEFRPKCGDQPIDREWFLCKFAELEMKCRQFEECAADPVKDRVTFICQNIHATSLHFANLWTDTKPTKVSHFPV